MRPWKQRIFHKLFKDVITEIYAKQIAAHPGYPEKPSISLLIGVWGEHLPAAYVIKVCETAVHLGGNLEAIGTGETLARYIVSKYDLASLNAQQCGVLAAFTINEAKKHVKECEGDSYIVSLNERGLWSIPRQTVNELEEWFATQISPPNLGKVPRRFQNVLQCDVGFGQNTTNH